MHEDVKKAIQMLVSVGESEDRDLSLPMIRKYYPTELQPYFGDDQTAGWLMLVEWFWMKALGHSGVMPREDALLMSDDLLLRLLSGITTKMQVDRERGTDGHKATKHDINALLELMREIMPKELHKWLHFGATSYDIIETAYSLQMRVAFENVVLPKMKSVDLLWCQKIESYLYIVQSGRTHLQTALPVTIGFWLAMLYGRYIESVRRLIGFARDIPFKFSGAVGTSASLKVLCGNDQAVYELEALLGLPLAKVSTQILPPERRGRFFNELFMLSGALANAGGDVRILQSSRYAELTTVGSTSSTMSHKTANPILAENLGGMHAHIFGEFTKFMLTLQSDLQRDLRWSSVMRGFSAIPLYVYSQLQTFERMLKSMGVDEAVCQKNFEVDARLVVAELLHLSLQSKGFPDAHSFVNDVIVKRARDTGRDLFDVFSLFSFDDDQEELQEIQGQVIEDSHVTNYLKNPEQYIGYAVEHSQRIMEDSLS